MTWSVDEFDIYYGVASGQQRAALRRLDPEAVMISYATQNNTRIDGDYNLFIDSGGYHHMQSGEAQYDDSIDDYMDYLRDIDPDIWAYRDYPCEPEILAANGRTVEQHQRMTSEAAVELADRNAPGQPVTVIQGWTKDQYLDHLGELKSRGLLTDYVGVGSVCRRGSDVEIAEILLAVRERLPDRCKLHGFGVKGSVLRFSEVVGAVDSVDSGAYDWSESHIPDNRPLDEFTWRDSARAYLNWRHETLIKAGTDVLRKSEWQDDLDGWT